MVSKLEEMATNRERIDSLKFGVDELRNEMGDIRGSLQRMEDVIQQLVETSMARGEVTNNSVRGRSQGEEIKNNRQLFWSKFNKLEFPKLVGNDPTWWFNREGKFFEFQEVPEDHKIQLAAYHLEGEANQWWQWLRKGYRDDG